MERSLTIMVVAGDNTWEPRPPAPAQKTAPFSSAAASQAL